MVILLLFNNVRFSIILVKSERRSTVEDRLTQIPNSGKMST